MILSDLVCMSANSTNVMKCRRNLKAKAVAYLGGCCIRCSYSRCIAALEFHHRDPSKKDFQIGAGGAYRRLDSLKPELDKCDLLCANCHREIHVEIIEAQTPLERRSTPQSTWPSSEDLSFWVHQETLRSLATRLGVSRGTVRHWCQVLGVELPKHRFRLPVATIPVKKSIYWPNPELLSSMVWRNPVTQIAKDLGVSDVAVKNHCIKLGISTPPRGYWAQQEALISAAARFPPISELRIKVSTTSYKKVAGEFGCNMKTLRNYILRKAV